MTAPLIEARGISRSFGSNLVNDDVNLTIRPGEVHAVLGENGAGKTTLMRMLSGFLTPDSGELLVDSVPVELRDPAHALELGIGMVHQHSVLVPELTVAENISLGRQPSWYSRYSRRTLEREVREVGERYGISLDPSARLADLSADLVQQVEIVRLLHRDVEVIILDEPTAILGRAYVDRLFETLDGLRRQGHAVVIITHKLREVMAIADRVTVLRAGRVTACLDRADFDEEILTKALIGDTERAAPAVETPRSEPTAGVLRVRDLHVVGDRGEVAVDGLELEVSGGEILGIAGVEGNGQRELMEALSGLRSISRGSVDIAGAELGKLTPAALDRAGVAVVSEDRLRWDIIGDLTLAENLWLSRIGAGDQTLTRAGFLRRREMDRQARERFAEFDVRPADPQAFAATLSGGNQQKLVLARETADRPRLLLAAHPTRGLDIAATGAVHSRLTSLRDSGSAILLVSADMDELLTLSDRILVLYRGRGVYESSTRDVDMTRVAQAMIGVTR